MTRYGRKKAAMPTTSSSAKKSHKAVSEPAATAPAGPAPIDLALPMDSRMHGPGTAEVSFDLGSEGQGGLSATSRLEMILAELERGCFAEDAPPALRPTGPAGKGASSRVYDPVGYIRKKMAALGFQAGIQLTSSGTVKSVPVEGTTSRDRLVFDGFPGDNDYELTFEDEEGNELLADDLENELELTGSSDYETCSEEEAVFVSSLLNQKRLANSVQVSLASSNGNYQEAFVSALQQQQQQVKQPARLDQAKMKLRQFIRALEDDINLGRKDSNFGLYDFADDLLGEDTERAAQAQEALANLDTFRAHSAKIKQRQTGQAPLSAASEAKAFEDVPSKPASESLNQKTVAQTVTQTATPTAVQTAANHRSNGSAANASMVASTRLVDPLKLQVIQSAEHELMTVHDLFEDASIPASQKLPLLKRKYMELMQQDIRHRLDSLRMRDYLDTLHLERQVVERELEKATQLKTTLEQLCDQLQTENAKIRAEKAGMSSDLYAELELSSLAEDVASAPGGKGKKKDKKPAEKTPIGMGVKNGNGLPSTLPLPLKPFSFEVPDQARLLDGCVDAKVLSSRVAVLIEAYNKREEQFSKVLKAKDAEISLLQTHYYAHSVQISKHTVANRDLSLKLEALNASETDLRTQLGVYVDKFRQVEETLAKSNDLFATFRHEMEQMNGKLQRLERENGSLQTKCATLSRNIIEMADERAKQSAAIETLRAQKSKLETLCRSMQAEKNSVLGKLAAIAGNTSESNAVDCDTVAEPIAAES